MMKFFEAEAVNEKGEKIEFVRTCCQSGLDKEYIQGGCCQSKRVEQTNSCGCNH